MRMPKMANKDVLGLILRSTIDVIGRRTSEAYANIVISSAINELKEKYDFLRYIEIKGSQYKEIYDVYTTQTIGVNKGDGNSTVYQYSLRNVGQYALEFKLTEEDVAPLIVAARDDTTNYLEDDSITWEVFGSVLTSYQIMVDSIVEVTDSIMSTSHKYIGFNTDTLSIGMHEIIMIVEDSEGRTSGDKVMLQVFPPQEMIIIAPDQVIIDLSEIDEPIEWYCYGAFVDSYKIYLEGIEIYSGTVIATEVNEISIAGFGAGNYTLEIVLYDIYGNTKTHKIDIIILLDYNGANFAIISTIISVLILSGLIFKKRKKGE